MTPANVSTLASSLRTLGEKTLTRPEDLAACRAWWTDAKFDFSHLLDWERIAIVTEAEWMRRAAHFYRLFGFLIGEIRSFPTAEASTARAWILEDQQ